MNRAPTRMPPLAARCADLRRFARRHRWELPAGQMAALLTDDWSGAGPLRLDDTLRLRELAGARMLRNARVLLGHARRRGVIPAVAARGDPARAPEGFSRDVRTGVRLRSGPLVEPLHWTARLLEVAGLVTGTAAGFALAPAGERLLDTRRAGSLYALLFRTYFRVFDIAYTDPFPAMPQIQDLVPYWLRVMSDARADVFQGDQFVWLYMPEPLRLDEAARPARLRALVQTRMLDALADFGLLAPQPGADEAQELGDVGFRRTPLFARFLRFELPPADFRLWRGGLALLR